MIETRVVKVSLVYPVDEAITQTCDTYGADGWRLGGVVTVAELHHVLLIFQRYSNTDPTATSGLGAS